LFVFDRSLVFRFFSIQKTIEEKSKKEEATTALVTVLEKKSPKII